MEKSQKPDPSQPQETMKQNKQESSDSIYDRSLEYSYFVKSHWNPLDTNFQDKLVHNYFDFNQPVYPHLTSHKMLQYMRIVLVIPSILIFILSLIKLRYSSLVIFLTQWANHIVIISFILSIYSGTFKYQHNLKLKRYAAISTQLAFVMQLIVVSIYWPLLHKLAMEKIMETTDEVMRTYLIYHMLFIHSIPFAAVTINVICSKVIFIPGHCTYLIMVALLYSFVNYCGVKYRGHFLYPFLKWEDYKSFVVVFGLTICGATLHIIVCFFVYHFKTQQLKAAQVYSKQSKTQESKSQ
ncbi:UNKNOWN [Stylonychia lemnae]|uniref:Uncharacterized protein n=1 Tax=Stylonychia lemnae TaxID=5949 RepID=A0A078ALQ4_STYLE|nr:UNKNOWN [Stylonychia lemnae]|eukprot:CDW82342.1 UNKNOWN [Stylonychia lemnae]